MLRVLVFLFLSFTFVLSSFAQSVKISGWVTNRQGEAVDMATVEERDVEGKILSSCISDPKGHFMMQISPVDSFALTISCLGYKDYSRKEQGRKDTYIEAVLDSDAFELGEVTVRSKMPVIHREVDRMVLNAERLNSTANTVLDVLKRAPGVIVQDDDISMLNKGKLVFLMNGRELKMDTKGLITYLKSLPSGSLQKIEIMTTPPAKYTAEGDAGVINFVTKKLKNNFIGGFVSNVLSVKEHTYDDPSISLQYKYNKVEAYVTVGGGMGKMQYDGLRTIDYPAETWSTTERRIKSNDYIMATSGIDYALTSHSTLGAIFAFNNMRPDADRTADTQVRSSSQEITRDFETLTNYDSNYNRYNANIHYTDNHIGKNGMMDFNIDYVNYHIDDEVNLQTTHDEGLNYLNRPRTLIRIFQAKADLENNLGKVKLSYGAAYSRSKTRSTTNYEYISRHEDLNDDFIYREDILAAYADMRWKLSDHWDFKLGLRGEYGRLDGNSVKLQQRTVKHQFDLFPTAFLEYSWNDSKSLYLSVTSRINRPVYADINPFTTYTDAHTITTGNPELLPEKSYSSELGYTWDDFTISGSMLFRKRVISAYTYVDAASKLTTNTVDNMMKNRMYSLDASYYFDKVSWFDWSTDLSLYTLVSRPTQGYDLPRVTNTAVYAYTNVNVFFDHQKNFSANIWGQYESKQKDVTGESPATYRMDIGLKYMLFHKKLSIGIAGQNLLASHSKSIVRSSATKYVYDYKPYRVFKLTLTYRFGKDLNMKSKHFGISNDRL